MNNPATKIFTHYSQAYASILVKTGKENERDKERENGKKGRRIKKKMANFKISLK